jgi:ribosomal protein S18 acetylase RimI-like enzyme
MPTSEPPSPPQTPGLTWRGLTDSDLGPWFALLSRIQDHDADRERTRLADLQTLAGQSWTDLGANALAAVDPDGEFRAVGNNGFRPGATDELSINLSGGVDPTWRGQGLGRALLEWQRARAVQNIADLRAVDARAAGLPGRIGCYVEEQIPSRARLLEASGFTARRWFTELRRTLDPAVPAPQPLPEGLRLEPFTDGVAERVRTAHNDAFLDHWGSNPHDEESWRTNLVEDEAFRPGQSFAIVDTTEPGEPVAAYVINTEWVEDWPALGYTEGYTEMVGVRRAWRGRGLARHLLALTARIFQDAGHPFATLHVDADNPSGALALYRSLGYESIHRTTYYAISA